MLCKCCAAFYIILKHYHMATIKAFIRTTKKNIDVNIRFRLSDGRDMQLFYISDIKINPNHFDAIKECYKTKIVCNEEVKLTINANINKIKELIATIYKNNKSSKNLTSDWLTKKINLAINKTDCTDCIDGRESIFALFDLFLSQAQVGEDRISHYKTTINLLKRFDYYMSLNNLDFKLDLNYMTTDMWYAFINYIQFESDITVNINYSKADRKIINNRSFNTTVAIWKRVKSFLNWTILRQYTSNSSYKMVKTKSEVYATPYYISSAERDMIYKYDLGSRAKLAVQRDIFIFHCLVGCRVGDLMDLKKDNVIDGAIEYIANKTKNERMSTIRVPLNGTALEIIKKYKDCDGDKLLPFISAQKYNDSIKALFGIVGLNRLVTIIDTAGCEKRVGINTIASSHLARRTFIGNLYKKVKDPNLVGALSGHSEGSKAFVRYREIDEDLKKEIINLL